MTQPQAGEARGNILVVDDTPANLRLLGAMLSDQGYKVRAVVNGEMALTAARSAPPDLILLDINMPDMSGYEVCRALKADERTSAIPVIFVSALDEALDKVKAFEVGGVDYITKPVQFEEVVMRVSTHLKLHRLQRAGGGAGAGERFVPPALATLFGRSGAADLRPGDNANFEGAVLVAVVRHTGNTVASVAASGAVTVSHLLACLGTIAAERGGFVERWRPGLAVAMFPGGLDQALAAARELRSRLHAHGAQPEARALPSLGVGLCSRRVTVGVVGDEQQVQVVWLDGADEVVGQIERIVRQSAEPIVFVDL